MIPRSYLSRWTKFKIIKNSISSVQAAETQSKGSCHPTTTISTLLLIKMLQPAETMFQAKMCEKITITSSVILIALTRILKTPHLINTEKCECAK